VFLCLLSYTSHHTHATYARIQTENWIAGCWLDSCQYNHTECI